jgi:phosphatidylglycerol---prolipoprotein diacylglyceryl transferase
MQLTAPYIDPIILTIGPLSLKWYGCLFAIGLLIGSLYVKRIIRLYQLNFSTTHIDNFFIWATVAIVLGGRLTYVILYSPQSYLNNPIDIFKIYEGGMSFHGGAFAMFFAIYIFCKQRSLEWKNLSDVLAISAPIVIALGRIGNFINGELWGRKTTVAWGMVFPYIDSFTRHPSQIYESLLEGVLLFIIIRLVVHKYNTLNKKGLTSGIFYLGYGCARIFAECFREPDLQIGFLGKYFTTGQLLSIPLLFLGTFLIWSALKKSTV